MLVAKNLPEDIRAFIVESYENGESCRVVAQEASEKFDLPIKKDAVLKVLHRDGASIRPATPHNGTRRSVHASGHVRIYLGRGDERASSSGYCLEHRLVAEEMLGRKLRDDEVVHHINAVPGDNRPENLCVMSLTLHNWTHHVLRALEREARDEYKKTTGRSLAKSVPFNMFYRPWFEFYIRPFLPYLERLEAGENVNIVLSEIQAIAQQQENDLKKDVS